MSGCIFFFVGEGGGAVHLHLNSVRTLGWLCFHGGILTVAFVRSYKRWSPKVAEIPVL